MLAKNKENSQLRPSELKTTADQSAVILSHTPVGVCMIGNDGKISGVRSDAIAKFFPELAAYDANVVEVLKNNTNLSDEDLATTQSTMFMLMGEDAVCFDLNKDTLPKITKIKVGPSKDRILELDWTPIIEDGVITRILLTATDTTESSMLREDAKRNAQEIAILNEIMVADSSALDQFLKSAANYLGKVKERIDSENRPLSREELIYARRIVHTIKGNARSAKLARMTTMMHEVEEIIFQDDVSIYMRNVFDPIKQALAVYIEWQEKIIQRAVDAVTEDIQPAKTIGNLFSQVIKDHLGLASEFGIKTFTGRVKSFSNMQLEPIVWGCLKDAMTHVVRNTIDHGLKGFKENADLSLEAKLNENRMTLIYEDHGRGINIAKISAATNKTGKPESRTPIELARLIFEDGISTSDKLTQISGRGSGMGAVRDLLAIAGGQVDIELVNQNDLGNWNFRLLIEIPA